MKVTFLRSSIKFKRYKYKDKQPLRQIVDKKNKRKNLK